MSLVFSGDVLKNLRQNKGDPIRDLCMHPRSLRQVSRRCLEYARSGTDSYQTDNVRISSYINNRNKLNILNLMTRFLKFIVDDTESSDCIPLPCHYMSMNLD